MFVQKWSDPVQRVLVGTLVPHSTSEAPSSELLTCAAERGTDYHLLCVAFLKWASVCGPSDEPSHEALVSFRRAWSTTCTKD